MEYGELLAKTYQLPQRQQMQQVGGQARQPRQQQAQDFDFSKVPGLDKAPEGLQYTTPGIAEQSRQYYRDWADLRNFAKTMWVKYGVDVTAPDPANEDSIWASEAFKQRIGLLMSGIDEAKRGAKLEETAWPMMLKGEVLPNQAYLGNQYAASMSPTAAFTPTAIDPLITQAAQELSGVYATSSKDVQARNQRIQNLRQQIQQRYAGQPADIQQRQLNAVDELLASYNPPEDSSSGAGTGNTAAALKEYALLAEGSSRYFKLPENPRYTPQGRPLYEAAPTGWVGTAFGQKREGTNKGRPFVISKVLYDYGDPANPYDGQAYFEDADGERLPVDKRNISTGFRTLIDSNRGMYNRADYENFLKQRGLGADIVPSYRLLDDYELQEVAQTQKQGKETSGQVAQQVKPAFDYYMGQVDATSKKVAKSFLGIPYQGTELDRAKIPLVNGQIAEIIPVEDQPGVYRIDNFSSLFPKGTQKDTYQVGNKVVTKTELTRISKDKLFQLLEYVGIDPRQAPTQQATPTFKAPNGYSYTREQLKAAGWSDADIDALPTN